MKMAKTEYAKLKGITVEKLNTETIAWLQSEGYDDNGNEYETLNAWLDRRPTIAPIDPYDGGRGFGQYGKEDM